ncbi:sarcosine oxidase subunit gamma [Frigidibacter mobilis]|uniref:Sarcosine oxidase, gamma subunit, putative n=1 Tax=Frigidibacter mobilis TaxID=1335048 RepID=A0A159Z6Y9_9RHOB|nr:hypothetical protein [Frigidibacter mobilis]AMY70244.1 sarcosine oxidase, gamma subunit, putative [Frigidibacter mobilis]
MASLIDKSPCEDLLPVITAGAQLAEAQPGPVTSVAPFKGRQAAVARALAAGGLGWPEVGRAVVAPAGRCLWAGRGVAFVTGLVPQGLEDLAALTDQSDGWAVLRLEGAQASAVLARLCPLDLRAAVFAPGHVARAPLGHMPAILHRTGAEAFEIWVFRSMAGTAVHELAVAMQGVAARG